jgi:hypothetical protein
MEDRYKQLKSEGVWELFLAHKPEDSKDEILGNCYAHLRQFWRMYYQLESLIESRNLKKWSFNFSNNVCRQALAWDATSFVSLFLSLMASLVVAMGGWMNEWIVLCILWEESQFLNIEKYRFDWL